MTRGFSRPMLLGAVLACQGVFYLGLQLGAHFPLERRAPAGETPLARWRRAQMDPARELRSGAPAPVVEGCKPDGKRATALLFLGDRDDCGTRSLMASWRHALTNRTDIRLVVVAGRFDAQLRLPCEGKGARAKVVTDPLGRAAGRFNAAWTPRSYLLNAQGRVLYAQPYTTADSRAAEEALATFDSRSATADPTGNGSGP